MHKNLNDDELLLRLSNGDELALSIIYKRYWEPLFVTAFNLFKDKEACEDIIQEIFVKLWAKRQEIEITVSLKGYLYASMRYEVYRQVRYGNARVSIFDVIEERLFTNNIDDVLEYKEMLAQISLVVETLPDKCREVYKLSREEQLSHKEISEKLKISTKTVENHITKALRILRMSLGQLFVIEFVSRFLDQQ